MLFDGVTRGCREGMQRTFLSRLITLVLFTNLTWDMFTNLIYLRALGAHKEAFYLSSAEALGRRGKAIRGKL